MQAAPSSNPENWISKTLDFVQDLAATHGPSVVLAIAMLLGGWWLIGVATRLLVRALKARKIDDTLVGFLRSIVHATLMTLVVIAVLDRIGIPTTSFVAVVGAAGLAIGFALQGSLSNFASGVMLVFFRPFRAGDLVEVAGQLGVVEEVEIFVTVIISLDNKKIVIPNGAITATNIINYSGKETRRVDMVFGIAYGDDIKQAKQVMERVLAENPLVLQEPAPQVAVSELADSSVNFVVRPWCKSEDYWDTCFSVTEEIKLALDASGISIPFPQQDVHMHQVA